MTTRVTLSGVKSLPPTITSDGGGATAAVNAAEGQTDITTVVATQAHGGGPISYAVTGGADAALVDIDPTTGELFFIDAPVFATPTDADTDGVYEVTVTATGRGGLTDSQDISTTVTEAPATPAWLPEGARSFVDFQNAHYYASGAEASVTDLFAGDMDNFGTSWSPSDISASGLAGTSAPQFAGALLADALMSGGSTIVFEFTSAATPNMGIDAVSGIDYATEVRISAYYDSTPSFFYDNVSQINLMGNQCDDGLNRVAMTFAASKLSLSVNGAAAETTPLGEGVFAMITQIPLIAHYDFLHSITVYPSQADGALPALSTLP